MIKKFTLLLLMVFVTIACYADKVTIADFSLSDNWSTDGTYVSYNTSTHVITSTKAEDGYLQNWCEGSSYIASKLTLTTESEAGLKVEVYYTSGNTSYMKANTTSFELALDATRVIQKIMIQTTGIESTGITLTSVKLELDDVTKVNLALFDAGTGVTWNTGTLSATFPGSWGNNYIQDWSNLKGKYATKLVVTTAGAANYQIDGKYTDETAIASSRIYNATKCEVPLDPTKAIDWVKITCTNDAGESVIFTDAYLVPTYLNEATTPILTDGSQAPVVLYRSITKNNWSTIVLPFAMTSEQLTSTFGAGVSVAELQNTSTANELIFNTVSATEANKPYAIKVTSDFSSATIPNVTIVSGTPTQTVGDWKFVGNYTTGIYIPVNSYYFSDNKLKKSTKQDNHPIKPFRAYFTYAGSGSPALSRGFTIDGQTTGINATILENDEVSDGKIYNLNGQQIAQPSKGLYIKNGKKYIIK